MLDSSDGPVAGRTAIQKIAYFDSVRLSLDFKYKPHFYGPYSPVLDESLMDLIASDYVDEMARTTILGRTLYSYRLTEDGHELVKQLENKYRKPLSAIRSVAAKCSKFGNNINVLSCAAKVHYLLSRKGSMMSSEEAIEMGRKFNWELSEEEIDSGVELLSSLRLVSKPD